MDPAPFPLNAVNLADMVVDPDSLPALHALGGSAGLCKGLGVDPAYGLDRADADLATDNNTPSGQRLAAEPEDTERTAPSSGSITADPGFVQASIEDRQRVFGTNHLILRPGKSLWLLMFLALQDRTLILLSIAAIISLALGFYTDFGAAPELLPCLNPPDGMDGCPAPDVDWVEGVAIVIAIAVVVGISSLNDWQKERKFRQLDAAKDRRDVTVLRCGSPRVVSAEQVVVGDVLLLEPGDILACDALFLRGHNVRCDESGATGESDMVRKATFEECWADHMASSTSEPVTSGNIVHEATAAEKEQGQRDDGTANRGARRSCFLLSGSKVLEGVGECLVIAVGQESFNGKLLMSLQSENEETPLQVQLNGLAEQIAKLGSLAGGILFIVLLIRFFVNLAQDPNRPSKDKGQEFIQILILVVTLIVVAVPEGLPLAVTLALAFATKRMFRRNLLVRILSACETMANASVVCTDKTGTLTQNRMSVVLGCVGLDLCFQAPERGFTANTMTNLPAQYVQDKGKAIVQHQADEALNPDREAPISSDELNSALSPSLISLLNDSIAVNSTAFVEDHATGSNAADRITQSSGDTREACTRLLFSSAWLPLKTTSRSLASRVTKMKASGTKRRNQETDDLVENQKDQFVGSKTETALLVLAQSQGWEDYRLARDKYKVVQVVPFGSERKAMAVVIEMPQDVGGYRLLIKGASEVLLRNSTSYVDTVRCKASGKTVPCCPLTDDVRTQLEARITAWASQSLRTIALGYRDFPQWPPPGAPLLNEPTNSLEYQGCADVEVDYKWLAQDLNWLAFMGIEDPLRPGVPDAVNACQRAGVDVKICTGDNILTARAIAAQCGILSPEGLVLEGSEFRHLAPDELRQTVPRLQVLARSSPQDKQLLVETLKSLGHTVGVTGDGTNDGPALKAAHIGFSMGKAGTEVAKEASDIILLDDNFASLVNAIMWGRCVNDAVRKFIQFQLSINIAAVLVTFVTAVANGKSDLTAVQLLYCNLCLDVFAALALATDPASPELLERPPARRGTAALHGSSQPEFDGEADAPGDYLISGQMWLLISTQAAYQVTVSLVLSFAGKSILGLHAEPGDKVALAEHDTLISTLVFNTFIWILLFNEFNARRLDRKLNVWAGMWSNPWFLAIIAFEAGIQVCIVYVGGAAFSVTRIEGKYWAISIVLGILTIPLNILVKLLVPTHKVEGRMRRKLGKVRKLLHVWWEMVNPITILHMAKLWLLEHLSNYLPGHVSQNKVPSHKENETSEPHGPGNLRNRVERQRTWEILIDDFEKHQDWYSASPALEAMANQMRMFQHVRGPRAAAQIGRGTAPSRANTELSLSNLPKPSPTRISAHSQHHEPGSSSLKRAPKKTEERKHKFWFSFSIPTAIERHVGNTEASDSALPRSGEAANNSLHAQTLMALAPALTCAVPAWVGTGPATDFPGDHCQSLSKDIRGPATDSQARAMDQAPAEMTAEDSKEHPDSLRLPSDDDKK